MGRFTTPAAVLAGLGAASQSEDADAGVITKGGKRIIEAFHGSPHKFDRFSMQNIGTGEGAQAYGHGLYFADSEDVARQYRDQLTQRISVDGKPILQNNTIVGSTGDKDFDDYLLAFGGDIDRVISEIDDEIAELNAIGREPRQLRPLYEWRQKAQELKDSGGVLSETGGSLYRVHLDVDPDTLLDWDKPLSEQPANVQEALRQLPDRQIREQIFGKDQWGMERSGNEVYAILQDYFRGGRPDNIFDGGTGALGQADASNELRDLGIPGIRYADGMSRGKEGEQTFNYVMFDDAPISIQERGMATPEMLAATAMASAAAAFTQRRAEKQGYWRQKREELLTSLGNAANFSFSALEMPWRGILGATRMAGGLAAGEGFNNALNAGVQQIRQPLEQTAYDLGGTATDATGSPAVGTAVNTAIQMGGPI